MICCTSIPRALQLNANLPPACRRSATRQGLYRAPISTVAPNRARRAVVRDGAESPKRRSLCLSSHKLSRLSVRRGSQSGKPRGGHVVVRVRLRMCVMVRVSRCTWCTWAFSASTDDPSLSLYRQRARHHEAIDARIAQKALPCRTFARGVPFHPVQPTYLSLCPNTSDCLTQWRRA